MMKPSICGKAKTTLTFLSKLFYPSQRPSVQAYPEYAVSFAAKELVKMQPEPALASFRCVHEDLGHDGRETSSGESFAKET